MNTPEIPGHVFWLYGLSGAGKSTLAEHLAADFRAAGRTVLRLDGDVLREGLCAELTFSEIDRTENLRRAAEAAKLGLLSHLVVIASFITPREKHRQLIHQIIGRQNVSFVFVNASLEVCQSRDVKGLYARASAGNVAQMTGISSPFESPSSPDIVIESGRDPVDECAARLRQFAFEKIESCS